MKHTLPKITLPGENDFWLIGIASHDNDYRLAWSINNNLHLSLVKADNVLIYHDKYKQEISLSFYVQEVPDQGLAFRLFANRGDNFFLLEDFKNIDYFLKIDGIITESRYHELLELLRRIDVIMGVFPLQIDQIKKINRILF